MTIKTGFLSGKKLLITGVLSNRSIAYGIAKACHAQGAELAFSYVGERFKDRITEFAADFDSKLIFDCDVGSDEQIAQLFTDLTVTWPKFDGFVHAIGYAPREAIAGDFLLHHDHVRPSRQRSSGEDAHRFARSQAATPAMAGGAFSNHAPGLVQIGPADRIAIHGGGIERRATTRGAQSARTESNRSTDRSSFLVPAVAPWPLVLHGATWRYGVIPYTCV
jgi:hypothetical protein